MATGGDEFGYKDPNLDHDIDNDGDEEEEVVRPNGYNDGAVQEQIDKTQPFQPGAASTPYHGGEQIQMETMQHEQSGLPDNSYVETPLLGDFTDTDVKRFRVGKALDYIKNRFPRVDFKKLGPIGFGKKQSTQTDIVSFGPKGGETPIFKKDGSGFLKSFTDKFKTSLGPSGTNHRRRQGYYSRAASKAC